MDQSIFNIICCEYCGRIRRFGEWIYIDNHIKNKLQSIIGEWDTILIDCPDCKNLEFQIGHA